jgi:glutamate-ammonia-ligase adenylyltransferase
MEATHRCLSDVAEVCLELVVERTIESFLGQGTAGGLGKDVKEVPMVLVALGKLGGQEPNYHSDLDLLFLYDAAQLSDESEASEPPMHFHQLAQSILQGVNRIGAGGKLYDLDVRLRPHGDSGPLAISLQDLENYFQSSAQLWERLMLCKARVVWGNPVGRRRTQEAICRILDSTQVHSSDAGQLVAMREKMQSGASLENLKRGEGGTVDVEFLVQWMQLKHGKSVPTLRASGTLAALRAIEREGLLPMEDCQQLAEGYAWLRRVESGLRLMNTVARHDLPSDPTQLDRLAFLLDQPTGQQLLDRCHATRKRLRSLFLKHLGSLSS